MTIQKGIRKFAIATAFRKPSPSMIPLSGPSLLSRNYRSVSLGTAAFKEQMSVREILDQGYLCWRFEAGSTDRSEVCVPFSALNYWQVHIRQYVGGREFHHNSAVHFLLSNMFRIPQLSWQVDRAQQALYNRRQLVRADRISVLTWIQGQSLDNLAFRATSASVMTWKYGPRWIWHPANENLRNYYSLLLSSLAQDGSLTKDRIFFSLTGKGLADIEKYETEERHHRDMVGQQRVVASLTGALVFVGVVQAWPTIERAVNWASAFFGTS